jgi:hypothetical protein
MGDVHATECSKNCLTIIVVVCADNEGVFAKSDSVSSMKRVTQGDLSLLSTICTSPDTISNTDLLLYDDLWLVQEGKEREGR